MIPDRLVEVPTVLVELTKLCEYGRMPTTVSLYVAKTHLSELGERAANGEEIVVTKPTTSTSPMSSSSASSAPATDGSAARHERLHSLGSG